MLKTLFGTVTVPASVRDELEHRSAPNEVRTWVASPPEWFHIEPDTKGKAEEDLARLHPGEREAIRLASHLHADLILLDELEARRVAAARGLRVAGLLGVLDVAAARGLVSVREVIERLSHTSFRATPSLLKGLIDRHIHP